MLNTRILPHKNLWWKEPPPPRAARMPGKRKRSQPVEESNSLRVSMRGNLSFAPSKRWVRYVDIPSTQRGYITELYNLRAVQIRYGLTQMTARYWRQHILPNPLELPTIKHVKAFYWSRIQLVALDTVLRWKESHGLLTIRKTDTDLLDLLDEGCAVLEQYYSAKYDEQVLYGLKDKNGVRFIG